MTISKSIKTDKVFEIVKQTIGSIFQKIDFIEQEKQILQILDELQIQNQVDNEMFSEGLKRNITTTYYERNPKARKKCLDCNF